MTLTQIAIELKEQKERMQRLKDAYSHALAVGQARVGELSAKMNMAKAGIDTQKVDAGLKVLAIKGKASSADSIISLAIDDLAAGCPHMKKKYFGIKVYSGFGEQREHHEYGYSPRHGSIVFSIGLTNSALRDLAEGKEIDTESAIYLLLNWKEVAAAKVEAA